MFITFPFLLLEDSKSSKEFYIRQVIMLRVNYFQNKLGLKKL